MSTDRILTATSQLSLEPTSLIYLPVLDYGHTRQFISNSLQKPTDNNLQRNIKQAFANHASLTALGHMIESFNKLLINYSGFPGLTTTQRVELAELLKKRKAYKALEDAHELDFEGCKALVRVSKKILPLNQMLFWSQANHTGLLKEDLWKDMTALIKEEEKKTILEGLQKEWLHYETFYAFTSEDLLEFYNKNILILENELSREIKSWHRYAEEIKQYLAFIHLQLLKIKTLVFYSMLYRLKCAEFTKDIACDDLILFTRNRIEQHCKIKLRGHGKNPEPRRSLTLNALLNFNTILENYSKEKHAEPLLVSAFNQLTIRNFSQSHHQSPVYLFFINTFPDLLKSAPNATLLTDTLLHTNAMQENGFILNRLKELLNCLTPEFIHDPAIIQAEENWQTLITDIKSIMENTVQQEFDSLLSDAFNLPGLDFVKISTCISHAKSLKTYCQIYSKNNQFTSTSDIIISIARYLKDLIAKNETITSTQCNNISKIMQLMYPELNPKQVEVLKQFLSKMPEICANSRSLNEPVLIHLLMGFLENALLDNVKSSEQLIDSFKLALTRHRYIANFYNEPWNNIESMEHPVQLLESYLENIILKLIKPCPYLTLDSLDMNYANRLLAQAEEFLATNATVKAAHQPTLQNLKTQAENMLFSKFNNRFLFAQHLHQENSHQINLDKLKNLLAANNRVFLNPNNNKHFLQLIIQTCKESLKTYFIFCITNQAEPDCTYIKAISQLLNRQLFSELCTDAELIKLMQTYVQTYDGSNTVLSRVLPQLMSPENISPNEKLLFNYAKKRLDYIKTSQEIHKDDYDFFSHFNQVNDINNLIKTARSHLYLILQSANDKDAKWQPDQAKIIELLGNTDTLHRYRLKRLLELVMTNGTEDQYDEFALTLNANRNINNRIININATLANGEKIETYIDDLIANKKWTYTLEQVMGHAATSTQLQKWHNNLLLLQLQKGIGFSHHWIGKILTKRNEELLKTNDPSTVNAAQQFLLNFFGETNLKSVCKILDKTLQHLWQASKDIEKTAITMEERNELIHTMNCIRPLLALHKTFSSNEQTKLTFLSLDKMEKKIKLYYQLSSEIGLHTQILRNSASNVVLNNVTTGLIETIKNIEHMDIIAHENVLAYLTFIDREIFLRLDKLLSDNQSQFEFNTLSTVANFIHRVISENTINFLHQVAKPELAQNMYWYKLINHFDNSDIIDEIESDIARIKNDPSRATQFVFSDNFDQTLALAKRLAHSKKAVYRLLNQNVLTEANISFTPTAALKFSTCLKPNNASDKKILKLWTICTSKLQATYLNQSAQVPYIDFLIDNLRDISNEILDRSLQDESLLEKFCKKVKTELSPIVTVIYNLFSKTASAYVHQSFWKDIPVYAKLIDPLNQIKYKTNTTFAMNEFNSYIKTKLPSSDIKSFNQFSNDATFAQESNTTAINLFKPKTSPLFWKNKLSNIELIYLMQLKKKLTAIYNEQDNINSFASFAKDLEKKADKNSDISGEFLKLLSKLRLQLATQPEVPLENPNQTHQWHPILQRTVTLE